MAVVAEPTSDAIAADGDVRRVVARDAGGAGKTQARREARQVVDRADALLIQLLRRIARHGEGHVHDALDPALGGHQHLLQRGVVGRHHMKR